MNIGFALCGSFCTYNQIFPIIERLAQAHEIFPILSPASACTDSRFGSAADNLAKLEAICKRKPMTTLTDVEPIGPKKMMDILVIAPCTGNTLAKLSSGIADTAVTMAAKSQLRNGRPVVIGISTNDALAAAAENIGRLLVRKNYYFVPFGQDDAVNKPTSMVADFTLLEATIDEAMQSRQIQPILL